MSLLKTYYKDNYKPDLAENYITLTTHNNKADTLNRSSLKELDGKSYFYKAIVDKDFAEKHGVKTAKSRLSDIEKIVNSFEGVHRSYAISAGREVRVLVENEKVSDEQTIMLSRDIARKIEQEMSYPGTIKVSVIRETRAVGIAK